MRAAAARIVALPVRLVWCRGERRLRAVPRLLLQRVAAGVLFFFGRGLAETTHADRALGDGLTLNVLCLALGVVGSVAVAARFLDRRPFADFGFAFGREWWLELGAGLGLGAALMAGVFLGEWSLGWLAITGTVTTVPPGRTFVLALLTPLAIFLCVGVYEELDARGYLLRNVAEALNFTALGPRRAVALAWVLTSALFGLGHLHNPHASLVSTAIIALAGLDLGLGYVLTGRLAMPIGFHISWNLFQGTVFGFPVSGQSIRGARVIAIVQGGPGLWTGGDFGPEAGLLGVAAEVAGAALILLWVRWRTGTIALDGSLARFRDRRTRTVPAATEQTSS